MGRGPGGGVEVRTEVAALLRRCTMLMRGAGGGGERAASSGVRVSSRVGRGGSDGVDGDVEGGALQGCPVLPAGPAACAVPRAPLPSPPPSTGHALVSLACALASLTRRQVRHQ